jgi:hypothetical protein
VDHERCVEKIISYMLQFITSLKKLAGVFMIQIRDTACKTDMPAVSPDYIKMRLINGGGVGWCLLTLRANCAES